MDTSAVPQPPREHHGEHARGDATRREQQLRTTLHCDDKEKLRRKLALLQREYLKTAERLQRAERLDAVRRHVRSRIGRQDRDQSDPEETAGPPSPWMPSATNGAAACPGHRDIDSFPKAPAGVSDASRRSPAIRFLLPFDAVGPQTPDPRHGAAAEAPRPSPALRLRSRRSRLRWERRSAEAGGGGSTTDDNGEEPRQQSGGTEAAGAEGREGGVRAEAANGGEEPLSCDDSESPSLLLAQWDDAPGPPGTGGSEGEEKRQGPQEKDGELPRRTAAPAEATEREATGKGTGGESREESDGRLFEDGSEKDTEQMAPELREKEKSPADTRGVMGSCTLVEGLLYPAEYYVRTTRRMALSQSQPDVQAVIFSQLGAGRHRARRGPTRSDRRAATGLSSPATCGGGDACGGLNSHSPGETSDPIPGCEISPDARVPARGRRKRRGGGGGRARTPRRPLSSDPNQRPGPGTTSGDPRTAGSPGDAAAPRDEPEAQPGSASGHTEKVFPIFLRTNGSRQTSKRSAACWRSLLLPPSPPAPTAPLPRPSHFPAPFFNHLLNFDFPQDFHLPDEQFASLKLLKLRRVAADPGVERVASASYNTRRCKRRPDSRGDPPAALALSGSPRPATSSPAEREHVEETEETPRGDTQEIPVEERLGNEPVRDCGERRVGTPPRNRAAGDAGEGDSGSSVVPSEGGAGGRVCARPQRPAEEPPDHSSSSSSGAAARSCDHGDAPGPKEPSDPAASPLSAAGRRVPSQLLLSPPGPSMTPHAPSQPAALCSPTLPSLGLSPHPLRAALPLTSSTPSAPSPTSSPPALLLSPRPAASSPYPAAATGAPPETPGRVEPPDSPTPPELQSPGSGGGAEEHVMRRTHTLKAPAGGCLVDACCLRGPSGALCVAAAAAWAVCLWSQRSAADWGLTHTWAFSKPVINVFPVPDAAGLVCVTLGPLEITEVRLLSCSRLSQAPLCEGVVQAVVGVSESRVVTSSHSPSGSTLRVFTASDDGSTSLSQPLASPGVRVGALAPVDGLSDALIGSDDGGRLLVWNLKTGQLLRRIALGDGLSHTSCLRGFSSGGALFVLLQHQQDAAKEDGEEREGAAPFSLVAVDPLSGRSALASRLRPPEGWSGRLCEADVCGGGGVVGLSRSGCACVWQLGGRGAPRVVGAPGSDGWQLARWGGGGGTLVTGHHNGDVTLHGRTG
ncbi:partner and localizer of BRCA2 [Pungitius pungitius]|uniref:partner and localizer of BRCA2 n=1 Tax=Pungitius pungitius TaxID=134920 RepID=UPI002E0DEFA2